MHSDFTTPALSRRSGTDGSRPPGALRAAIKDHLAEFGASGFGAILANLSRTHPLTRNSLSTALYRMTRRGLVVRATLDELERSYGPALAAELALRGWTK